MKIIFVLSKVKVNFLIKKFIGNTLENTLSKIEHL